MKADSEFLSEDSPKLSSFAMEKKRAEDGSPPWENNNGSGFHPSKRRPDWSTRTLVPAAKRYPYP
jgi:hypothetical protein